jgi:hypothetical protein
MRRVVSTQTNPASGLPLPRCSIRHGTQTWEGSLLTVTLPTGYIGEFEIINDHWSGKSTQRLTEQQHPSHAGQLAPAGSWIRISHPGRWSHCYRDSWRHDERMWEGSIWVTCTE